MSSEQIEQIKKRLSKYSRREVIFSEHAQEQIILRNGDLQEVVKNLIDPRKLVDFSIEEGTKGDKKYNLIFQISNTRHLKIPVIFDPKKRKSKSLYILTYIDRPRRWHKAKRFKNG